MNNFYSGQKLEANDLNNLLKVAKGPEFATQQDVGRINTADGSYVWEFDKFAPKKFSNPKILDISWDIDAQNLKKDDDLLAKSYIWMAVRNIPNSNLTITNVTFNGDWVYFMASACFDASHNLIARKYVPGLDEEQTPYDRTKVDIGSDGMCWWNTGLWKIDESFITDDTYTAAYDICGRILKLNVPAEHNGTAYALLIGYRSDIQSELATDESMQLLRNKLSFKAADNTTMTIDRFVTPAFDIAVLTKDKYTKLSYVQSCNSFHYYHPNLAWNIKYDKYLPYTGTRRITIENPVYELNNRQYFLSNQICCTVELSQPEDDVGTLLYLLRDLSTDQVTLSTEAYPYELTYINQLATLISALADINTKLIAWVYPGGIDYFDTNPVFDSLISTIPLDSLVSGLSLSSLQYHTSNTGIKDPITSAYISATYQELYNFHSELSTQHVADDVYTDQEGYGILARYTDASEHNARVSLEYLELSTLLISGDANVPFSQTSSVTLYSDQYKNRCYMVDGFDGKTKKLSSDISADIDNWDVLVRHYDINKLRWFMEYYSLKELIGGGGALSSESIPKTFDIEEGTDSSGQKTYTVKRCRIYAGGQELATTDTPLTGPGNVFIHINRSSSGYSLAVNQNSSAQTATHVCYQIYERSNNKVTCDMRMGEVNVFQL